MKIPTLTAKRRRRLYVVSGAALVVAKLYGLVSEGEVAVWLNFIAAVLGVTAAGVAVGHVTPDEHVGGIPDGLDNDIDLPVVKP